MSTKTPQITIHHLNNSRSERFCERPVQLSVVDMSVY